MNTVHIVNPFIFFNLKYSLDSISPKTMSEVGGLHQMLGLKEHIFVAIPRDSILSLPDYGSTNKIGASFETPCGRRLVMFRNFVIVIIAITRSRVILCAVEIGIN